VRPTNYVSPLLIYITTTLVVFGQEMSFVFSTRRSITIFLRDYHLKIKIYTVFPDHNPELHDMKIRSDITFKFSNNVCQVSSSLQISQTNFLRFSHFPVSATCTIYQNLFILIPIIIFKPHPANVENMVSS
jgi:hypothetical protein